MDMQKLKEQLEIDEGVVYEIYLDHLGYETFGIGHLIKKSDPEHGLPVGTPVSKERVNESFEEDCNIVVGDCVIWVGQRYAWEQFPEEVKQIIGNMMFNMGRPRMSKFKRFRLAVLDHDWEKAAIEMQDSRWYKQVGKRASRLVERMSNI